MLLTVSTVNVYSQDDEIIPPDEPLEIMPPNVFTMSPNYGYITTTYNITFTGFGLLNSTLKPMSGVIINGVTLNTDTLLRINVTVLKDAVIGNRDLIVTNSAGQSDIYPISIKGYPKADFYANPSTLICNIGGSVDFYSNSKNGLTYKWDFGMGATSKSDKYGNMTVTYSSIGKKTVKLKVITPIGVDSITKYVEIKANKPNPPKSIIGYKDVCKYMSGVVVYKLPQLGQTPTYKWVVPAGVTITKTGLNYIVVKFDPTFKIGVISVTALNGCGESLPTSIKINNVPAVPTAILGPISVIGLTTGVYSIKNSIVDYIYNWKAPLGTTIISGQGTKTITLAFDTTFVSGNLGVSASNGCYEGAKQILTIKNK